MALIMALVLTHVAEAQDTRPRQVNPPQIDPIVGSDDHFPKGVASKQNPGLVIPGAFAK